MRVRDSQTGKYVNKWKARAKRTYLPFVGQLTAIALIADKHPHSEAFLANVEKVARDLAAVDGVDLELAQSRYCCPEAALPETNTFRLPEGDQ